ncbi:hypothetical protein QT397_22165 [Microbulbifer sp. MKSA007]|uniref:hypothetical protein n=1 Tax=Microbulbifer sp. TRSA007 TaxID=3243384 RepID=UPI002B30131F|nr:hypothetical protein QT397_22165 [Microbulbifer sp. MKSA007]
MQRSVLKYIPLLVAIFLIGCSPSWSDGPYEIYWIDGEKALGFNLGDDAYIRRIDKPHHISANEMFVSVYACPEGACVYYYIDRLKDHKFADSSKFVFGPYTEKTFVQLEQKLKLPTLEQ